MKRTCREIYPRVWNRKKIPFDNKAPEVDCGQFAIGFENAAKEPGLPPGVRRLPLKLLRRESVGSEQCIWKSVEGRDENQQQGLRNQQNGSRRAKRGGPHDWLM